MRNHQANVSTDATKYPFAPRSQSVSDRFGYRVRTLRRGAGWTQLQLAQHLGIDRSYISDLERGVKNPTLFYMETIAQGFGMTLSDLVADI